MLLLAPCALNHLKATAVDGSVRSKDTVNKVNNVRTCWKEEEEFILYSVVNESDFIG
jgi:hypothetical protein